MGLPAFQSFFSAVSGSSKSLSRDNSKSVNSNSNEMPRISQKVSDCAWVLALAAQRLP